MTAQPAPRALRRTRVPTGRHERRRLLASSRLTGVDAARGLAIVGMLVVHLTMPVGLLELPAGRSSALFAVLAGVTLTLLTGGASPTDDPARRRRLRVSVALRGLTLTALGLALWLIPGLPFAIIIDVYGVLIVMLVPLLYAPRRLLVVVAIAFGTAGALVVAVVGFQYVPQDQRLAHLPSVWLVTGEYPGLVYIAYFLMGMTAGRSDLRRRATQTRMVLIGVAMSAVGYGVGCAVPGQYATPHSDTTWEVLGDGGVALVVIGLMQLICGLPGAARALTPLAALGSLSLTVYVLQVIAVLFWPFSYVSDALLGLLIVGSTAFALIWRGTLGRGPLEALVARASLLGWASRDRP